MSLVVKVLLGIEADEINTHWYYIATTIISVYVFPTCAGASVTRMTCFSERVSYLCRTMILQELWSYICISSSIILTELLCLLEINFFLKLYINLMRIILFN